MRKLVPLVLGAMLVTGVPLAAGSAAGGIPNAASVRACAAAGPYWPTMTLALSGDTAWVACKEQSRIMRMALPGGRKTATVRSDAPVIAVAIGLRLVWALDSELDALPHRPGAGPRDEAHPGRRERGVQHLDRRRLGLGRRRPGRQRAADLTCDEQGRRAASRSATGRPTWSSPGRGLAPDPSRQRPLPHRHDDATGDAPRRPSAAAMRRPSGLPTSAAASGSQAAASSCSRSIPSTGATGRRSTSAERGSTSSLRPARSGCRSGRLEVDQYRLSRR